MSGRNMCVHRCQRLLLCVVLAIGTVQMGGCSSLAGMPNDPQQLTQQIGQRLDELDAKYEQTEHAIIARIDLMNQTDIPADDPSRLAMESMLAETQTMRSALETARAKLVQVARETEAITSGTGLVLTRSTDSAC